MKKTLTCLLALLLASVLFVTVFTACKSDKKDDEGAKETTGETEAPVLDDTPNIKEGVLTFKEGNGIKVDPYSIYLAEAKNQKVYSTYETWLKLPEDLSADLGTVISDYMGSDYSYFMLKIVKKGVPQINIKNSKTVIMTKFNDVKLPANEWVHLAIVDDAANNKMYCYVNGELKQTVELDARYKDFKREASNNRIVVGNDNGQGIQNPFKGSIKSIALFETVRTQDQVKADMKSIKLSEALSCFDTSNSQDKATLVDHCGRNTVVNNRKTADWLEPSKVKELSDFDYSLVVVGDTQQTVDFYPETFNVMFDWLIKNKESHKIEHLVNVGDFTQNNTEREWKSVTEQYFRLNGVLDYTLTRGDHDVKQDSTRYDKIFNVKEYTSRFEAADAGFITSGGSSITNSYRKVKIGGEDYLIITLDYDPTSSELAWAKGILEKYKTEKVIVTNHRYLSPSGTRLTEGNNIFKTVSKYSNVLFCICGHKIENNVIWSKAKAEDGHIINQVLVNPQGGATDEDALDNKGPLAMVCMLYFKKGSNDVQVRYYSTFHDKFYRQYNQFTVDIVSPDAPVRTK